MHGLALALSFLTRLPAPTRDWTPRALGWALFWFPAVGVLLASLLLGLSCVLQTVVAPGLSPAVFAALLLAGWVWLTGGLHLDGLADSADGLAAAHGNPARGLEVMRDPRIGAHGASTLIVVLLLKFAALQHWFALTLGSCWAQWLSLASALCAARFWVAVCVSGFAPARAEGLGARFQGAASRKLAWLGLVVWLGLLGMAYAWQPQLALGLLWSLAVSGGVVLLLARAWARKFGGLTGDLHGASLELGETAALLCWVVYLAR